MTTVDRDPVTNAELGRRLDDLRDDLGEFGRRLEATDARYVPREVYEARHAALILRVERIEMELQRAEVERRTQAVTQEAEARSARRWLVSAVIVPTVLTIVTIIMNIQGPA